MKLITTLLLLTLTPLTAVAHGIGEHFHPHLEWYHIVLGLVVGIGFSQRKAIARVIARRKK